MFVITLKDVVQMSVLAVFLAACLAMYLTFLYREHKLNKKRKGDDD